MKTKFFVLFLSLSLLLTGCGKKEEGQPTPTPGTGDTPLGDDSTSFGAELSETGIYDGYFEGASTDVTVTCLSGTPGAYLLEGTKLTFTEISEASVYAVSGTLRGEIVIDVGDAYKLDLELHGLSLVSDTENPITVLSGDEVAIKAKKDTKNYIYDMRAAIDSADETLHAGAIHSEVDLEMGGKGELFLLSENNNGIHSKDDLQVKNLTLLVACVDNALKGNDSVEIEGGSTTLIATGGDAVKTSKSDISDKGNQRGSITVTGGTHTLYAAADGMDAAYDVVIEGTDTVINIYTEKYSNYTAAIAEAAVSYPTGGMPEEPVMPPDGGMGARPDGGMGARPDGGMGGRPGGGMGMPGGGMGGMNEGNPNKSEGSSKGIKAANAVLLHAGTLNIKSHDDAIHASTGTALENGETPKGGVTVTGGTLTLYSGDDGLHADGALVLSGGSVCVLSSYEGIEGETVTLSGATVSVNAKDDGVNATATSGEGVKISGGRLYVYAAGDGIDSNSRTSYRGILFSGGESVIISTSGGNSAIDTEAGYTYTAGKHLALMPKGSMTNEAVHCESFASVGSMTEASLSGGSFLVAEMGDTTLTVKLPVTMSAHVIVLGDTDPEIELREESTAQLDGNGVAWR